MTKKLKHDRRVVFKEVLELTYPIIYTYGGSNVLSDPRNYSIL